MFSIFLKNFAVAVSALVFLSACGQVKFQANSADQNSNLQVELPSEQVPPKSMASGGTILSASRGVQVESVIGQPLLSHQTQKGKIHLEEGYIFAQGRFGL